MNADSSLERARDADFDALMAWFDDASKTRRWGGPRFRYPFTSDTFREDCRWPAMDSFSLWSPARELIAFGQFYDRLGRINLARLVVHPDRRGQGIGKTLITELMAVGRQQLPLDAFSLFVYRDNEPALRCYQALGFEIDEYPDDDGLAETCYYMTRPV